MGNCNWEIIIQNGWFEDFKHVYSKEFPWEIRSTLSNWLARDDSFMSFDPNVPSHHDWIFVFIGALISELKQSIDIQTSQDDAYFFYRQRLLKLLKRVKAQDPMHLFQVVRDTLTCEKQKIQEMSLSGSSKSTALPTPCTLEKTFAQTQEEIDGALTCIHEKCTYLDKTVPEISNRYTTLRYNLYMLQQQQQNTNGMVGNGYPNPDNQPIPSMEEVQAESTRFNQDMKACYQLMIEIMAQVPQVHSSVLKELEIWRDEQRLVVLGKLAGNKLESIEKWFRTMSTCFEILQRKLPVYKMLCENFPPEYMNNVQAAIDQIGTLRESMVKVSLVISKEPKQILRANTNFGPVHLVVLPFCTNMMINSVKAIFINSKTAVEYFSKSDKSQPPTKSGDLKFGKGGLKVIGSKIECQTLTVSTVSKSSKRGEQFVVEERFWIYFRVTVNWQGHPITLNTTSLPISVTSHPVQEGKAWTHILWYNAFPVESRLNFQVPDDISWDNLIQAINLRFISLGRGLSDDQRSYLKDRLFSGCVPANNMVSKSRFCYDTFVTGKVDPETSEDGNSIKNYTFGEWLFCCLKILSWAHKNGKWAKYGLKHLWEEGKIEGFMSKEKLEMLLKGTKTGTFIIRFPENMPDYIALYFYNNSATTKEKLLKQLLTIKDFNIKPLQDRILDSKVATYLYPNTKREDAFTRMYKNDTSIVNGYIIPGHQEYLPRKFLESFKNTLNIEQDTPSPAPSQNNILPYLPTFNYNACSPSTDSVRSEDSSTTGSCTSFSPGSPNNSNGSFWMDDLPAVSLDGFDPRILLDDSDL